MAMAKFRIAVWRVMRERTDYGRHRQEFVWHMDAYGRSQFVEYRTEAEANSAAAIYNLRLDGWKYVAFGIIG